MKTGILLRACPRCRGDLFHGVDDELSCLQCGYEPDAKTSAQLLQRLNASRKPAAVAA
jgi:exosome complex RNA-binding protein Csl4